MSEHGSFATNIIHCDKCRKIIVDVMRSHDTFNKSVEVHMDMVIGRTGGMYSGEDHVNFTTDVGPKILEAICHNNIIVCIFSEGEDVITYDMTKENWWD